MNPLIAALAAVVVLGASGPALADDDVQRYAVTITNITRGQNMAPPAVITHNGRFAMFRLGAPASPGLARLAEDGNGRALLTEIAGESSVYATAIGAGGLRPGASQTIEIESTRAFPHISVGAMLGTSNDAFMAIEGARLPLRGWRTLYATGYDAGSETNSQDCTFVPGPPCGDTAHNPAPSEGYVHVHIGIHGGGAGLDPALHDWRNPVAQVEIKRVK